MGYGGDMSSERVWQVCSRTITSTVMTSRTGLIEMLGRDPDLHHPPRLGWDGLIAALAEAGVQVTERDLIETPFTAELTSSVQAELDPL